MSILTKLFLGSSMEPVGRAARIRGQIALNLTPPANAPIQHWTTGPLDQYAIGPLAKWPNGSAENCPTT
uniref:HDC18493 n=1 Tax=Drosophila melanogaster TaxID=7227 RepID=Q6IIF1_DROME|nr:TPA_inf: HDC18493 [Drosophila melanogaster]